MTYWRSGLFWLLFVVGWLVTGVFLSLVARVFSSFEEMPPREIWIVGTSIHFFSLLSGFAFARNKVIRPRQQRGFEVASRGKAL
jgi:hypothetical protein